MSVRAISASSSGRETRVTLTKSQMAQAQSAVGNLSSSNKFIALSKSQLTESQLAQIQSILKRESLPKKPARTISATPQGQKTQVTLPKSRIAQLRSFLKKASIPKGAVRFVTLDKHLLARIRSGAITKIRLSEKSVRPVSAAPQSRQTHLPLAEKPKSILKKTSLTTKSVGPDSAVPHLERTRRVIAESRKDQTRDFLKENPFPKKAEFHTADRAYALLTGKHFAGRGDFWFPAKFPAQHEQTVQEILDFCKNPEFEGERRDQFNANLDKLEDSDPVICMAALRKAILHSWALQSPQGWIFILQAELQEVEDKHNHPCAERRTLAREREIYKFFMLARELSKNPDLFQIDQFPALEESLELMEDLFPGISCSVLKEALIEAEISGNNPALIAFLQKKIGTAKHKFNFQPADKYRIGNVRVENAYFDLTGTIYKICKAGPMEVLAYDILDEVGNHKRPEIYSIERDTMLDHLLNTAPSNYLPVLRAAIELAENTGQVRLAGSLRERLAEARENQARFSKTDESVGQNKFRSSRELGLPLEVQQNEPKSLWGRVSDCFRTTFLGAKNERLMTDEMRLAKAWETRTSPYRKTARAEKRDWIRMSMTWEPQEPGKDESRKNFFTSTDDAEERELEALYSMAKYQSKRNVQRAKPSAAETAAPLPEKTTRLEFRKENQTLEFDGATIIADPYKDEPSTPYPGRRRNSNFFTPQQNLHS